ncbi:3538_t:CDS:2, partial [Entrophospora sp. SA101]
WQVILEKSEENPLIEDFEKCDLTSIYNYLQEEKEQRIFQKRKNKNGHKEKIGNFRIEPLGLFKDHGDHPKTGSLNLRVTSKQITINISKDALIPPPPAGHSWDDILPSNSSLKGQIDLKKFDNTRELNKHIEKICCYYALDLKDRLSSVCQHAMAMYLIGKLSLRAGNEKTDEEADTVVCCSLRCEHITLVPPMTVKFNFLAKDSIRYINSVEVIEQVFKNLKIFLKDKGSTELLFDRLKNEWKSSKVNPKKGQTSEKLWSQIEKLTECIKTTKLLKQDKEDNKTTALGTSKINYLDPHIS